MTHPALRPLLPDIASRYERARSEGIERPLVVVLSPRSTLGADWIRSFFGPDVLAKTTKPLVFAIDAARFHAGLPPEERARYVAMLVRHEHMQASDQRTIAPTLYILDNTLVFACLSSDRPTPSADPRRMMN